MSMKNAREIKLRFFRVNYWEPTNLGEIITELKYFKTKGDAKRFALKLVKGMEKEYKDTRDMPIVEIVDESDNVIMAWRMENGKVVGSRTTLLSR